MWYVVILYIVIRPKAFNYKKGYNMVHLSIKMYILAAIGIEVSFSIGHSSIYLLHRIIHIVTTFIYNISSTISLLGGLFSS